MRFTKLYTYDFLDFILGKNIKFHEPKQNKEEKNFIRSWKFHTRIRMFLVLKMPRLLDLDRLEIYIRIFNISKDIFSEKKIIRSQNLPRMYYRLKNYDYKPYVYAYKNYTWKQFRNQSKKHFMYGLLSIWQAFRRWILSVVLGLSSIYFLSAIRLLSVSVTLFQWFALAMFLYWLLSGFVFFIKKYQFTRFTSSIQRFWRRSYILFWLIESCLLLVFFYLTMNSTQESPFMLDQIQIFKTHLFSWRSFLPKLFLVTALVILGYLLLLSIRWNIFKKSIPFILVITLLLTYLLWIEFYQIYHVSNFYANFFWSYDIDDKVWSLEVDARRTRIVNHYVMILFLLKFWHIVFIYGFWIFFVLRANELTRTRYPLYSANFQNFIILYVMSWLFMYPWLKVTFHRFLEVPYFWFYMNNRELGLRVFFNDIKLVFYALDKFSLNTDLLGFKVWDYVYWHASNNITGYESYRKHWIRDNIISTLSTYQIK